MVSLSKNYEQNSIIQLIIINFIGTSVIFPTGKSIKKTTGILLVNFH